MAAEVHPLVAAEVHGVEEAAGGQRAEAFTGVEGVGQPSELAEVPSSELGEDVASTHVELTTPHVSAGEAPSGLGRLGEEFTEESVASVNRPVTEAAGVAAEAGQQLEPHIDVAVRELAHRLYYLGIDVEPSVLAAYVEKYGGEAFDAVVREVAKALAASYRVPYAAGEVEELVKKYGLEQASAALKAAKEEAARGEDVREVLKRLLNQ